MSTPYAGTEVEPTTITLPDDGDGASVFIAALAANKDAIEWLADRARALNISQSPQGTAGTSECQITETTTETQVTVGVIPVLAEALLTDLEAGDVVLAFASANFVPVGTIPTIRLVFEGDASTVSLHETTMNPSLHQGHATLVGAHTVTADTECSVYLTVENDVATGGTYTWVYGQISVVAMRIRA